MGFFRALSKCGVTYKRKVLSTAKNTQASIFNLYAFILLTSTIATGMNLLVVITHPLYQLFGRGVVAVPRNI